MTVVSLTAYLASLDSRVPANGWVTVTQWQGTRPAKRYDGEQVVVGAVRSVRIVAGEPVEVLDVEPTDGTFCVRFQVRVPSESFTDTRYVAVPPVGPVNYEALVDVDPESFEPSGPVVTPWLVEDPTSPGLYIIPS